jgi:hypothetical protein
LQGCNLNDAFDMVGNRPVFKTQAPTWPSPLKA